VLGWSWLLPPYRWHFDARATSTLEAITLDSVLLRQLCEEDHDLGYELTKRFASVLLQQLQAPRFALMRT
jgi:CRP/FNR family transcriptional regulator, cyclic AMP receptor protein